MPTPSHPVKAAIACAFLATSFAQAATYTVASLSQLESTVNTLAVAGDTVQLAAGVYSGNINLSASGTSVAPITVKSIAPGAARVTGDASITLTGAYVTLRDFDFQGIRSVSGATCEHVVRLLGADNCRVLNNRFRDCGHASNPTRQIVRLESGAQNNEVAFNSWTNSSGISLGIVVNNNPGNNANTGNAFRYNSFSDIAAVGSIFPGLDNGMECIQVGQDFGYSALPGAAVIEFNRFVNVTGDGNEMISQKVGGATIRYNTFENCNSSIALRFGAASQVVGNFFRNTVGTTLNTNRGVIVYDRDHVVANNYFEGMTQMAVWLDAGYDSTHLAAQNVMVLNNTLAYQPSHGIRLGRNNVTVNPPTGCILRNNLVRQSAGTAIRIYAESGTSYVANYVKVSNGAAVGVTSPGVVTTVDPLLNLANGFYRPFSSAINDLGSVPSAYASLLAEDMDAEARLNSPSAVDIGADEGVATYSTPAPVRYMDDGDAGAGWSAQNISLADNFEGGLGLWTAEQGSVGTNFLLVNESGNQRLKLVQNPSLGHPSLRLTGGSSSWANYTVESTLKITRAGTNSASILGRYQGLSNWYSFAYRHDVGRWGIGKRVGTTMYNLVTSPSYGLPNDVEKRVRCVLSGSTLQLWTLESGGWVKQCEVTDTQYTSGKVGFTAYDTDAVYDDILVY